MKRILLIEDERNMSRFIELELQHEGYSVTVAYDGMVGLHLALGEEWDIILLDLMLPSMNGLDICCKVRAMKLTPIIMLTARDSIEDRVQGLDYGADDYIPKPFAIEELLARMRVVLRRQDQQDAIDAELVTLLDVQVNMNTREVRRGEQLIELTKREFDLLVAFMNHPNQVMSREVLLDTVWGFDAVVDTNVVDVYVRYLRNKLDRLGDISYIQTIRGIGYVMKK